MQTSSYDLASQALACGPGKSFCAAAMQSSYDETHRSDSCAAETYAKDADAFLSYHTWLPPYANKVTRGNAFLNASVDTNRFSPKQVTQESFLQGRGQVTSNKSCQEGHLNYLPQEQFTGSAEPKQAWDMSLFSQQTVVPRSCASLTELDLIDRLRPVAGAYEGAWSPFPLQVSPKPARLRGTGDTVTLSTKRYPTFEELKAQHDRRFDD